MNLNMQWLQKWFLIDELPARDMNDTSLAAEEDHLRDSTVHLVDF